MSVRIEAQPVRCTSATDGLSFEEPDMDGFHDLVISGIDDRYVVAVPIGYINMSLVFCGDDHVGVQSCFDLPDHFPIGRIDDGHVAPGCSPGSG